MTCKIDFSIPGKNVPALLFLKGAEFPFQKEELKKFLKFHEC